MKMLLCFFVLITLARYSIVWSLPTTLPHLAPILIPYTYPAVNKKKDANSRMKRFIRKLNPFNCLNGSCY